MYGRGIFWAGSISHDIDLLDKAFRGVRGCSRYGIMSQSIERDSKDVYYAHEPIANWYLISDAPQLLLAAPRDQDSGPTVERQLLTKVPGSGSAPSACGGNYSILLYPCGRSTLDLAGGPLPPLDAHLYGGEAPVLSMVVPLTVDAGACLCLVVGEDGEDAEDDGDAGVELDAHEAVGDGVGDVLKVHGLALDEDADGDDGVEGGGAGGAGEGGQVCGRGGEEVGRGGPGVGRVLDLRGRDEAVMNGSAAMSPQLVLGLSDRAEARGITTPARCPSGEAP